MTHKPLANFAVPLTLGGDRDALVVTHFSEPGDEQTPLPRVLFTLDTAAGVHVSWHLNVADLEAFATFLLRRARSIEAAADHAAVDSMRVDDRRALDHQLATGVVA